MSSSSSSSKNNKNNNFNNINIKNKNKLRPVASGYARLAQADEEEALNAHRSRTNASIAYRDHPLHLDDNDYDDPYNNSDPFATPPTVSVAPNGENAATRYGNWASRAKGPKLQMQMHYPSNVGQPLPRSSSSAAATASGRRNGPMRHHRADSGGVDIKAINMRLEKWAEEIANKFKINKVKGKSDEEEKLDIHVSVFQPPDGIRPYTAEKLEELFAENEKNRLSPEEFDKIVDSVRTAISNGIHPKMISQGSSGSYFARNTEGKVVGVFKPKDEEPYASRNPKWTKWIHRNLFPCCFGRACLIPNLSYVSEAAAYVLDTRLQTNLVPYTDIVWLSSRSFFYDFWDRRKVWGGRSALPAKVGSFQVFLKGFKDANIFLREHPWPDQGTATSVFRSASGSRRKKRGWNEACRPSTTISDDEDEAEDEENSLDDEDYMQCQTTDFADRTSRTPTPGESMSRAPTIEELHRKFRWTETLKQSFREELEKLVILDYIMRNTDRGLDNWMVKIDTSAESVSIVTEPISAALGVSPIQPNHMDDSDDDDDDNDNDNDGDNDLNLSELIPHRPVTLSNQQYRKQSPMVVSPGATTPASSATSSALTGQTTLSLGAIDNSLSWPWKHPDAWRSFPFGWLFLPVSLIGQPFSQKTRDHFLPLLTSTAWWSGTQTALRKVFIQDADFKESMFARQIAVMKGQAWNVVETLKEPDHGPLELTRRTRVCVWDDLVDIPVAIPLRNPESERYKRRHRDEDGSVATRENRARDPFKTDEEMDIGAVFTSAGSAGEGNQLADLLSLGGTPTSELPNPYRFELTSPLSATAAATEQHVPPSSSPLPQPPRDPPRARPTSISPHDTRDFTKSFPAAAPSSTAATAAVTNPVPDRNASYHDIADDRGALFGRDRDARYDQDARDMLFNADDLEGDLGYAAAERLERRATRKVIVERLETVQKPAARQQLPVRSIPSAPTAAEPVPAPAPAAADTTGITARAEYDYEKAEDNEIDLVENEMIYNIQKVDEDWWLGTNGKGETGLFPSNYVVEVEEEAAGSGAGAGAVPAAPVSPAGPVQVEPAVPSAAAAPAAAAGGNHSAKPTATSLYDYEAAEDNELGFPEGAKITNLVYDANEKLQEFPDEDWWFGEFNGKSGLFPANYVELDQ
ncbi:phosphatidyl inositol kinase [Ascosphaera aggregata]|nr:phosphatidyl inositol kinase [Ascosphaera aggregata]